MRVALELQPCCGKRSGIGVYTYELAKRLEARDGLAFEGNLFNFLRRNDNSVSLEGICIPLRECRLFPYGVYRRIWHVLPIPYQRLFPGSADLSVFFNYIVPPHISGKVITTIHDMTYLRFPETVEAKNLRRLRKGMSYSIKRSDHILTVSEFSKREIIELLGVPEEKISVVPNAAPMPQKGMEFASCAQKFGITGPYLFYVGNIEPRKNLARLIGAYAQLKREKGIPHQLVLAGGKGWGNEEIHQTASGVEGVLFTGYLTEAEKATLYQNAEAFVFPSLYEGFGIPPLEAMSYGCPVVCANAASLPEVVGDAAELVDPLSEVDIARGIWRVLSDRERAAELVRRGYKQIKEYTWDASAEKLRQVCKAVLEEK